MKKLSFYTLAATALAVLFAFTACNDPADDNGNGGNNGGGTGVPEEGTSLIDKVVRTNDYGDITTYKFNYDDKNRLVGFDVTYSDMEPDELAGVTISYAENTVTVTDSGQYWDTPSDDTRAAGRFDRKGRDRKHSNRRHAVGTRAEGDVLVKHSEISVYNLNSEGFITSLASASEKEWEDGVLVYEETYDNITSAITYSGGKIARTTSEEEYGGDASYRTIYTYTGDYTWTGNNMTKLVETERESYPDEPDMEDEESIYEYVFTYGDQKNPTDVNFDVSIYATDVFSEDNMLGGLGFFGRSPENLVASSPFSIPDDGYYDNYIYTWELDNDGLITKATVRNVWGYESGEESERTDEYVITYKK